MSYAKRNPNDNTKSPMHSIIRGAENNDFAEVNLAIQEDSLAIVQREPRTGMTALHVAAGDGNLRMAKHLLTFPGADLSLVDRFGRTPLDMAIAVGHRGISEMFSRVLYPHCFPADTFGPGPT